MVSRWHWILWIFAVHIKTAAVDSSMCDIIIIIISWMIKCCITTPSVTYYQIISVAVTLTDNVKTFSVWEHCEEQTLEQINKSRLELCLKLDSKGFGPAARANAIFEAVTNKSWQNFTICHFLRSSCRNELGVRVCTPKKFFWLSPKVLRTYLKCTSFTSESYRARWEASVQTR